jgi:hypothetical protein
MYTGLPRCVKLPDDGRKGRARCIFPRDADIIEIVARKTERQTKEDGPMPSPFPKLPVDLQSFQLLREKNFLYVDKNAYIHRMLEEGGITSWPGRGGSARA